MPWHAQRHQVIKRIVEESNSIVESPGNKYKLCTKDNIQYKRITCKEDIAKLATEIVQQPAKKSNEESSKQPVIHAIYEEGCILNLWHKLYRDKRVKFECNLRMKDRNIIGFDILNINRRNIFVRGTQEVGVKEDIYFGDEKKYNSYRNLRQEMFSKFFCLLPTKVIIRRKCNKCFIQILKVELREGLRVSWA